METKQIKLEDVELGISHVIKDKFEIVIIKDSNDLDLANENIKDIRGKKKTYLSITEPLKKLVYGIHRKITSTEKRNTEIYDAEISKQQKEIDAYNKALYDKQKAIEEQKRQSLQAKALRQEKERKIEAQKEAENLQAEKDKLDDSWDNWEAGSISPESKQLENDIALCEQAASANMPLEIEKVNMFSAKNRVKPKETYSIGDTEEYIEWAINNERTLIKIEPALSVFHQWVKLGNNSKKSFVKTKVGYK